MNGVTKCFPLYLRFVQADRFCAHGFAADRCNIICNSRAWSVIVSLIELISSTLVSQLQATATPYDASRHVAARSEIDQLTSTDKQAAVLAGQLLRELPAQTDLSQANSALADASGRRLTIQSERDAIGFSEPTFAALRTEYETAAQTKQQTETAAIAATHDEQRATDALASAEREIQRTAEAREKVTGLDTERLRLEALDRAYTDLRAELNAKLRPELAAIASALLDALTDGHYTEAEFDENYVLTLHKDGVPQQVIAGVVEKLDVETRDAAHSALATAIITHNADIAGMANRVVHMSNGQVSHVDHNQQRKNPRELHW